MCGIAGGIGLTDQASAVVGSWATGQLDAALDTLRLRGPDAHGKHIMGHVCMGQTRLSILDLTPAGNQPMYDPTGRYALVFNGEVFNFQTLKQELPAIAWRSNTDTEVVLHLLLRDGIDCLNRLNGFFALALHDTHTGDVLIARDRYGIKPLHIYQDADRLLFASELKALLALGAPRVIDPASIRLFFELNYLPPHDGIFQGMRKLPAGGWLRVQQGQVSEGSYYTLPSGPAPGVPFIANEYEAAQRQVVSLLDKAVQLRLISDVPVGVYLSGGIDSSVVAGLAARHTSKLHSFSISFDNPLFDEAEYALAVAKQFGTEHTVFRLTNDELFSHLDGVLDYLDEPFADASALNFYVLSKYARPHITVALTGDAADELFGGYSRHEAEARVRSGGLLNGLLRTVAGPLQYLPAHRNSKLGRKLFQAQKLAKGLTLNAQDRYWRWVSVDGRIPVTELVRLPADEAELARRRARYTGLMTNPSDLNQMLATDMQLVLTGDMMVKGDLMSMANSLEVRTPFLDYDLVDYVAALPQQYKLGGGMRKRILQDAFRSMLPPMLYNRPKQGFEVPLRDWFIGPMRSHLEQHVLHRDLLENQGIFDPVAVQRLWHVVLAGQNTKEDWTLWALVVFQNFWRKYMR